MDAKPVGACQMRVSWPCSVTVFALAAACAQHLAGPLADRVPAIVVSLAPPSWAIVEDAREQVPEGHYWGDWGRDYRGPKGRHVVFMGPRSVSFAWRDRAGAWQQEDLAKETLELWIMPGAYRESWASWLNPHAPLHAKLIFGGTAVKVYAKPAARVTSEARVREILQSATETGGFDSSERERSLSWSTWRPDLQRALNVQDTGER